MTMNRRHFIGATAAGAAVAATNRVVSAADGQLYPRCPDSKIRVRKIYLAKPKPSWPTPKLDVQAEVERLEREIAKLQPEIPEVEFVGGELYRTIEQLGDNVREKIGDVDAVLVFNLTSTVGHMVRAIAKEGVPTILYSQPYSGHDWSGVESLQEEGCKIICLATSEYGEIADALRPIRALRRMRESKVVVLRGGAVSKEYSDAAKNALGTDIISIDGKRMMAAYDATNLALAQEFADRWSKGATKIVEPTPETLTKSARLYLAMCRIMAEEKAQGFAINCLGMFAAGQLPAYPCLGFAQLNDDGFVGACEADTDSMLTMLLFQYMAAKPGFITDPVIDTSKNQVIHAHCVSPRKMDGPNGPSSPYVIRSHMEDDKGAALQVTMRVGETITMARLVNNEQILMSTGKIVDTPVLERGCRTKITTVVPDARKMLEGYHHGLHRVIFYGDHMLDIKRLCYFNPAIKMVVEG